jgi:dTDP-4-amino-4,6-dideoxygalactose transaminase
MSNWQRTYYSFARFAFHDALSLCGVGPGDVVLLPAFICRDVLAPVNALGGVVHFYGVDRHLQPVINSIPDQPKAILAVNYFGFPQQLSALEHLAQQTGAVVIEDNAHGLLSQDSSGLNLGKRTGIGFTSFRKTIRVVNGAFLDADVNLFPNCTSLAALGRPRSEAPLPLGHLTRLAISKIEQLTKLPLMNFSRTAIRSMRQASSKPTIPVSNESERLMPNDPAIHQSALSALQQLDDDKERRRRQIRFALIANRLMNENFSLIHESLPPRTVPWAVPFYTEPGRLHLAQRALRGLGAEIISWPDLPEATRSASPDYFHQVHVVTLMK